MTHDRDSCLICWDRRCDGLERQGLSRRLVAEVRACLPATTARTMATLESATPTQLAALNTFYAKHGTQEGIDWVDAEAAKRGLNRSEMLRLMLAFAQKKMPPMKPTP